MSGSPAGRWPKRPIFKRFSICFHCGNSRWPGLRPAGEKGLFLHGFPYVFIVDKAGGRVSGRPAGRKGHFSHGLHCGNSRAQENRQPAPKRSKNPHPRESITKHSHGWMLILLGAGFWSSWVWVPGALGDEFLLLLGAGSRCCWGRVFDSLGRG